MYLAVASRRLFFLVWLIPLPRVRLGEEAFTLSMLACTCREQTVFQGWACAGPRDPSWGFGVVVADLVGCHFFI